MVVYEHVYRSTCYNLCLLEKSTDIVRTRLIVGHDDPTVEIVIHVINHWFDTNNCSWEEALSS